MSIAPMLPPTIMPRPRRPGEAVVIPFPGPRESPDGPLAVPIPLRPRRRGRAEPAPAEPEPAEPTAPADPAATPPGPWPAARPHRVVRPARRPGSGGLRLTRRGRAVLVAATLTVLVAVGALGARLVPTRGAIPPSAPAVVQVQPGDTLWGIAQRVAPDADTRAVVDAIAARNGLVGGAVHPGQRLVIRP